jgi:NAD(P)-dependent dehydrogenase (short-subunit alcohol dehydrogenase family)
LACIGSAWHDHGWQDAGMALGFDTTTDEALEGIDLTGQRILVTGASAGLGQETVRALAAAGAEVVMPVRDPSKGGAAASAIRESVPDARLESGELDLASLASVRACAARFLDEHDRLDGLICNAGIMACPQGTTSDGFETQMGTNHVGHFLLATLLEPALLAGAPSRVVSLTSAGHKFSDVDLDDPWFERTPYDPWLSYGRSKSANALFALALDRRLGDQGVHAWSVHPGGIHTELGRHLTEESLSALAGARRGRAAPKWKSIPQGAATSVWAVTAPELVDHGGRYLEDCGVAPLVEEAGAENGVMRYAQDPDHADELWSWSEAVVNR